MDINVTSIPGNVNHCRNILDLFFTFDPHKYIINIKALLGKYDYSLITVSCLTEAIPTHNAPLRNPRKTVKFE